MLIIGAGHIGVACAQLAKSLGFRVVVWDDRAELATREHVPSADELETGDIVGKLQTLEVLPQTYIVLVTRLHTLDAELLRAAIDKPASYIGMLGSERRVLTVFKMLREQGVREEDLGRVHAPIGVKIGAETPAEIAVSIMAEVIQAKSKDEGRG